MQDVSVIIPNFNGKKYLKECLDSLRKQDYLYFEVILVDNGSEDGSVEWTKENYPEVRVIALKENTGFCGGVNAGIRESKSEYVLLLNNDTIVFPEFITELVHAIERAPDIFSCQAKMLQIQDERRWMTQETFTAHLDGHLPMERENRSQSTIRPEKSLLPVRELRFIAKKF